MVNKYIRFGFPVWSRHTTFPYHVTFWVTLKLGETSNLHETPHTILLVNIFSLIRCYLLLEKGRAIHWGTPPPKKNLNSLSPKMLCAESGRNWPSGSGEDVDIFSLFLYYLPLKNGGALHLNKLESFSPKNALCQVLLKLTQSFWRRCRKCEKLTDKRTDGRWTMGDLSFQPR